MKTRMSLLIALLLVLPLVLAACGGGPASNAEKFIEAAVDGDKDEAEKYVCDDNKDELIADVDEGEAIGELKEVSCEEDGDDVKCEVTLEIDGEEQKLTLTYIMKDDKVCGLKSAE